MHSTNRDTRNYVDSCHKESEIRAAYLEKSTSHFKNVANITVDSDSVIPQDRKKKARNTVRQILITKMILIR